jgi:DNA polymerase-1
VTANARPLHVLIDTSSLLFRSFYALPPMETSRGVPTSALYGTCSLLLKVLREHGRPGVRMAFAREGRTRGRPTFRHEAWPAYKAGRPKTPSPLVQQLQQFDDLASMLGIAVHRVEGFEADDVLATLAASRPGDADVLVVSGDADLLATADASGDGPGVRVLFVGRRAKEHVLVDADRLFDRYRVPRTHIPLLRAFLGDPSDNVPGIDGVGPKTAARWVVEHGGLDEILAAAEDGALGRLSERVAAEAEALRAWVRVLTLRTDLDLPPLESATSTPDLQGFRTVFESLEFRSLERRLPRILEGVATPGGSR